MLERAEMVIFLTEAAVFSALIVYILLKCEHEWRWLALLLGCGILADVGMSIASLSRLVGPQAQTLLGIVALVGAVIGYLTVAVMWWRQHPQRVQTTFVWVLTSLLSEGHPGTFAPRTIPLIGVLSTVLSVSALCAGLALALWAIFRPRRHRAGR